MYNKFLIIASKQDPAGMNITSQLSQFRGNVFMGSLSKNKRFFDFYFVDESILYSGNLDHKKINNYDFVIFASTHKSESNKKTLSIHAPGNWNEANMGGQPGKVCKTSALFQKYIFKKLKENIKKYDLRNYDLTLECTHHGPLIDRPCIFIEIGSTETEWKDRRAGFVIAKTISDSIDSFKENSYNEVAIGIGGPHYCPKFNKFQLNSNVAISHIIPQYAMPITEEVIKEAWEKTEEDPDFAILEWKGLGNSEERKKVIDILEENHLPWKRDSEITR